MSTEVAHHRAIAAVRFVHPITRRPVTDGLRVSCEGARLRPNRSGLWVVFAAEGFDDFVLSGPRPSVPAAGSVTLDLTVADAQGRFLARSFQLQVPSSEGSVATVALPLSPAAPTLPAWSLLRLSVQWDADADHPAPVPLDGVLLRLVRTDDDTLVCTGIPDARAEALLVAAGIPRVTVSDPADAIRMLEETSAYVHGRIAEVGGFDATEETLYHRLGFGGLV